MDKKYFFIIGIVLVLIAAAVVYLFWKPNLRGKIVIPYIAHQKPTIDPHLPSSNQLSDKLDEVLFDGLFNAVATASGVVYEDGLGEFIDISEDFIVTVRLKTNKKWHNSYKVNVDDEKIDISKNKDIFFTANDLSFTLMRIQNLGSLSPDYILVAQALKTFDFSGPDENGDIKFIFKADRIWKDADIKEVLSFKILPANSDMNALNYYVGTASYLTVNQVSGTPNFYKTPDSRASIANIILSPFIDNSTFTTEIKNNKINLILETPFGSVSPILSDTTAFFIKTNISTTFFAILFNTERLNLEQRREVRKLINNKILVERFFRVNSPQQRQIVDYKGNRNNYYDYINNSVFPTSSYYVDEKIVVPEIDNTPPNLSILSNIVDIKACVHYGFREEYGELIDILNDPAFTKQRVKVTAVKNEDVKTRNYDALLIAISGYRSNFLFDLYNIFMREPDFETNKINLVATSDAAGKQVISESTWQAHNNFFSLDTKIQSTESKNIDQLMRYIYGFMSTKEIGDKQAYAERIDKLERELCLGVWLFSLPSIAYFTTQFDSTSVQLYGVASQLSTIKKWKETKDK